MSYSVVKVLYTYNFTKQCSLNCRSKFPHTTHPAFRDFISKGFYKSEMNTHGDAVHDCILLVERLYGIFCKEEANLRLSREQFRCGQYVVHSAHRRFTCLRLHDSLLLCFHGSALELSLASGRIIPSAQTVQDWQANINITLTPAPDIVPSGLLHSGFLSCFREIQTALDEAVRPVKSENLTVWLTGHSLGGALALICGLYLARRFQVYICTMGSPRIGNAEANNWLRSIAHIYHLQTALDPFPQTPGYRFGYSDNRGKTIKINDGGVDTSNSWLMQLNQHRMHAYLNRRGLFSTLV